MLFEAKIIEWYQLSKRDLPWRKTTDPYAIWVSEIILQQTRVAQGLEYYLNFMSRFPTVDHLAEAEENEVLRAWQGLGYYSRARNMHHTARTVSKQFRGVFPSSYNDLVNLKGIGEYTASAILSIAFSQPYPVVDGNIIRVISRITGITRNPRLPENLRRIKRIMEELMAGFEPGIFNQALMEFGALICVPGKPDCDSCIIRECCFAFQNNMTDTIPVASQKKEKRVRQFAYLVISFADGEQDNIVLKKRGQNDIWANLYEFPCFEKGSNDKKWSAETEIERLFHGVKMKFSMIKAHKQYKHQLTHQVILADFFTVKMEIDPKHFDYFKQKLTAHSLTAVPLIKHELKRFPVHRLVDKFLTEYFVF